MVVTGPSPVLFFVFETLTELPDGEIPLGRKNKSWWWVVCVGATFVVLNVARLRASYWLVFILTSVMLKFIARIDVPKM